MQQHSPLQGGHGVTQPRGQETGLLIPSLLIVTAHVNDNFVAAFDHHIDFDGLATHLAIFNVALVVDADVDLDALRLTAVGTEDFVAGFHGFEREN